ncbi:MAG: DUF1501 domain-containing protein, partial [Verrucomicrobiota bacterium]
MNIPKQIHFLEEQKKAITRRWFFKQCGVGVGTMALNSLLAQSLLGKSANSLQTNALSPKAAQVAPKARRVIYLFMAGAPSHLDLFDYKPELAKWNGKLPPAEL